MASMYRLSSALYPCSNFMVSLQLQPPTDPEATNRKTTNREFLVQPLISFPSCQLDASPPIASSMVAIRTQGAAMPLRHPFHCPFPSPPWLSRRIHLDFSELRSFTQVRDQFRPWGIQFSDAIALQPSNPAFANSEQPIGLMPISQQVPLTIYFNLPYQQVNVGLVGVKQIVVRVFNDAPPCLKAKSVLPCTTDKPAEQCIAEQHLGQSSYSSAHNPAAPVRHQVQVQATAITKLEIISEAPFLLNCLICG